MNSIENVQVRIYSDDGRQIVGTGFLIPNLRIITCAHVVQRANSLLNTDMSQTDLSQETFILFDFPFRQVEKQYKARLVLFNPEIDIAGLEIQDDLDFSINNLGFAELINANIVEVYKHRIVAYGFPQAHESGVYAQGEIIGRRVDGNWQIQDTKEVGYLIWSGFSGAPVWDDELKGILGMIVSYEQDKQIRAAFMIPVSLLIESWPGYITTSLVPERKYLEDLIYSLSRSAGIEKFVEPTIEVEIDKQKNDSNISTWPSEFSSLLGNNKLDEKIKQPSTQLIRVLSHEIGNLLPKFVLLGDPGSGKTTVLYKMAAAAAQKRITDKTAPIPLYINLSRWAYPNISEKNQGLDEYIRTIWSLMGDPIEMIEKGDIVLFLDGVDEMGNFIVKGMKLLRDWLNSNHAPKLMRVACREGDYVTEIDLGLQKAYIRDLDTQSIQRFTNSFLGSKAYQLLNRLEVDSALAATAKSPYFLSAMIFMVENGDNLPSNRSLLIERIYMTAWERERLEEKHKVKVPPSQDLDDIFGRLAYKMFEGNLSRDVSGEWAISQITLNRLWKGESANMLETTASIITTARNAHLLIHDRGRIRFHHTFLQEHFAAKYIVKNLVERTPLIVSKDGKFEWAQWSPVLEMLLEIVAEQDLFNAILERSPYLVLCFSDQKYKYLLKSRKLSIAESLNLKIENTRFEEPILQNSLNITKEAFYLVKDEEIENHLINTAVDFDNRMEQRISTVCILGEIGGSKALQALQQIKKKYETLIQEEERKINELRSIRDPKRMEKILKILWGVLKILGIVGLLLLAVAFELYVRGRTSGSLSGTLKDDLKQVLKNMKNIDNLLGSDNYTASFGTSLAGFGIKEVSSADIGSSYKDLVDRKFVELGQKIDSANNSKKKLVDEYARLNQHLHGAIRKIERRI